MWRGAWAGGGLFLLAGLVWALYDPLMAWQEIQRLGGADVDALRLEQSLLARSSGAWRPLRNGLRSENMLRRQRCAKILALQGESEGVQALLVDLAKASVSDSSASGTPPKFTRSRTDCARAEQFLRTIWEQRRAPPARELGPALWRPTPQEWLNVPEPAEGARKPGLEGELDQDDPAREGGGALNQALRELDRLLKAYPNWAGGWAARSRINLLLDDAQGARQNALSALRLEPDYFDALALLGYALQRLSQHENAALCFERALQLDPFLSEELEAALKKAQEKGTQERERRLKARQAERPQV